MQHPQLRSKIWRLGTHLVIPRDTACHCGQSLYANPLVTAAEVGDLPCIISLTSSGFFDINHCGVLSDPYQSWSYRLSLPCRCATALTAAILEGNVDIAHLLLKKRACPNRHSSASIDLVSPLVAAIITSNIQMAQTLLLAGATSYDQLALDSISLELGLEFIELLLDFLRVIATSTGSSGI